MNRHTSKAVFNKGERIEGDKLDEGAAYMYTNGESRVDVFFDFEKQWCSFNDSHQTDSPDWDDIGAWLEEVEASASYDHGIAGGEEPLSDHFLRRMKQGFKSNK